jgi:hypothetical protein
MPTWAIALWVVVVTAGILLWRRDRIAREAQDRSPRAPVTTEDRLHRARQAVAVTWLLVGLLAAVGPEIGLARVIGIGSFLGSCLWRIDLGPPPPLGPMYCGLEYPAAGLIPLVYGVAATALVLAGADVLGRPLVRFWQLALVVWALILVPAGWMAPETIVCHPTLGTPPTTCLTAWRPGFEWLAIFALGPLLIALASRLVERWSGPRTAPAAVPT